jgi:hypothetical protein
MVGAHVVLGREIGVTDQSLVQRGFTTILECFVSSGRAPHYSELADELGIEMEVARELQRAAAEAAPIAGYWLARDTDFIESWAPGYMPSPFARSRAGSGAFN